MNWTAFLLRYLLINTLCIVSGMGIHGQTPFSFYNPDNKPYQSALSGGFLAPQFSSFDLDRDGKLEMITFDRFSGIVQVWAPAEGIPAYDLIREPGVEWPILQNWMLVRDFNRDGIPDIFTQGFHGIAVHQGYIEKSLIKFEKLSGTSFIDDSLIFHNRSGGTTNIYHASTDIPIIQDLDGDGDLDILTFELSGSYLYYYENRFDESGSHLDFVLRHNCWGYFSEDQFSEDINLTDSDITCPPAFSVRHAGSSSCLLDYNNDSLPDLLLGDIGSSTLKVLINQGSQDTSLITGLVSEFPDPDSPAVLRFFPAAYLIDVNKDSIMDVVIAVNEYPSTDHEGIWTYLGTGNPDRPFTLYKKNWLEQETIDLGQYASPYYMDVNNDGIDDLLVGYQVTDETFHPVNKIAYFEALNSHEFQLKDQDFLGLSEILKGGYRPYVTSGDVDGDGHVDLLVGLSDGTSYMIFNRSGPGKLFEPRKIEQNWGGLQMLSGATPELFDMDGDGDLDVIAGFDNGTIGLYINTGNSGQAIFDLNTDHAPHISMLGQIRTVGENSLLGRSAPRILIDGTDTILVSGSHKGYFYAYYVDTEDLKSPFTEVDPGKWPAWIGTNGRVTLKKVNDQTIHMMAGNIAGGLTDHFVDLIPTYTNQPEFPVISIYPNPANAGEMLHFGPVESYRSKTLNVYYPTGQLWKRIDLTSGQNQIDTSGWRPGIYFLQIIFRDNRTMVHKIIVQ
ncbi:MAG TPA: T9SS type A sorting domain-containing protein [Membranihabitans sp.]|nr:T9SS type A sorting domain-containing protein [Membranihabitans sp.]